MNTDICFDLDGTIVNLYGEPNWLKDILSAKTKPYRNAKPLVNMRKLGKELNRLQTQGYNLKVISWSCKGCTNDFHAKTTQTKKQWLKKHLSAVKWNDIIIVPYNTPKHQFGQGILFDDEPQNRTEWQGIAYDETNVIYQLQQL